MLVLSRTEQESITVGDNVVVRVLEISGNRVRIGIQAPRDLQIWRTELLLKKEDTGDDE
jgi:carbon storage regulator